MATYFHVTGVLVEPDALISPGNWGRMLRLYSQQSMPQNPQEGMRLTRELIFENIRLAEFPQLPSRLRACFACESEAHAREFQFNERYLDVIYEVEIADTTAPTHRGGMNLTNWPQVPVGQPVVSMLSYFEVAARHYWSGTHCDIPEIVTTSPLRVLRRIK